MYTLHTSGYRHDLNMYIYIHTYIYIQYPSYHIISYHFASFHFISYNFRVTIIINTLNMHHASCIMYHTPCIMYGFHIPCIIWFHRQRSRLSLRVAAEAGILLFTSNWLYGEPLAQWVETRRLILRGSPVGWTSRVVLCKGLGLLVHLQLVL